MPGTATLTIELSKLRNQEGVVCIALFDSAAGYPDDASQAVRTGTFEITSIPLVITFDELPYGTYGVASFHDENADAKINKNLLGIPKEGIGFSENPPLWKGAPSFEKIDFDFNPDNTRISIAIKYFKI